MLNKPDAAADKKEPIVIKKYANRRLYNTETSTYVTLDDLAQMVRNERDFVVYDAKTSEDLTHAVLTQIIVEQEGRSDQTLLPIPFLRQLIRFYGAGFEKLVPSYLQMSMDMFTREQERFRTQFGGAFGSNIFDAFQEQTRKNLAAFEQAMTMFTPFGAAMAARRAESQPAAPSEPKPPAPAADSSPKQTSSPPPVNTELDVLKAQLAAMQAQLEKLSERKG